MASNFLASKDIVIIAYGEIKSELRSGKTAPEMASEVAEQLYDRTGLTNRDIDGLAINLPAAEVGNSFYSNILADNLGIEAALAAANGYRRLCGAGQHRACCGGA